MKTSNEITHNHVTSQAFGERTDRGDVIRVVVAVKIRPHRTTRSIQRHFKLRGRILLIQRDFGDGISGATLQRYQSCRS
jgi:hypothetical protein